MSATPSGQKPAKVKRQKFKSKPALSAGSYHLSGHGAALTLRKPSLFVFTMIVIYKNLYILGAALILRKRRMNRRIKRGLVWLRAAARERAPILAKACLRFLSLFIGRMLAPYTRIRNYYRMQRPFIWQKRARGKIPVAEYLGIFGLVLRMFGHILFTAFNYAVPVAALIFLFTTVNSALDRPVGLLVSYETDDGPIELGYVHTEKEYADATQDVMNRLIADAAFTKPNPIFTLKEISGADVFLDTEDLANKIIIASGNEITYAHGFYVNNEFFGALADSDRILDELDKIRNQSSSGKPGESLVFDKSVRVTEGRLYPIDSVVEIEGILRRLNSLEAYNEIYIVQAGDSPSLIADKLGVPYSLLREMNPGMEDGVYVGDKIFTARARPFLSVRSIFRDVYEESTPFDIIETQNATYARGFRSVTQRGEPGQMLVTAEITTLNGIEIGREVLDVEILVEPVPERAVVGVNNPNAVVSGGQGFIWPTRARYITFGLGGYPGHTGIDIPGRYGDPIYASASGTVIAARHLTSGYGRYIDIDHGNGYMTRYAHCSSLYVSVGDVVGQGQIIAAMGSTGRSTGNHLHFEVRYLGRVHNPVNYVGRGG